MIYIASMYGSLVGSQLLLQFREFVVKVNILDTGFHTHHSYCMQGVCSFILGNACRSKSSVVLDFHVHLKLSRFWVKQGFSLKFQGRGLLHFFVQIGLYHSFASVSLCAIMKLVKEVPFVFCFYLC